MQIKWKNDKHEDFVEKCLLRCHISEWNPEYFCLFYTLGLTDDCVKNIEQIFDFTSHLLKVESLHQGWVTGTDRRIMYLAFHLFNGGMPTVFTMETDGNYSQEELLKEAGYYTPANLFSYGDLKEYQLEALRLRYI